jgi:TIR domain
MVDFFISYNRADKTWAEWIGWTLETAGYEVRIDAWDFRPGGNFALEMQRAIVESRKTIAVLSESYLNAVYVHPEWAAAFAADPLGVERKLIPVKVRECKPTGTPEPNETVESVYFGGAFGEFGKGGEDR